MLLEMGSRSSVEKVKSGGSGHRITQDEFETKGQAILSKDAWQVFKSDPTGFIEDRL